MEKNILKKILQLDSLICFLDWSDRTEIHIYNKNSIIDRITSIKVLSAYEWILKENWEPPQMKYGQDRLLYFYDPDSETYHLAENYLKKHPKYKEELIRLKI